MSFFEAFLLVAFIALLTPFVVYLSVKLGTIAKLRAIVFFKNLLNEEGKHHGKDKT